VGGEGERHPSGVLLRNFECGQRKIVVIQSQILGLDVSNSKDLGADRKIFLEKAFADFS
jgi:hypothetical protein